MMSRGLKSRPRNGLASDKIDSAWVTNAVDAEAVGWQLQAPKHQLESEQIAVGGQNAGGAS